MQILNISENIVIPPDLPMTSKYVDGLLGKGIFNDYIFEKVYWEVRVKPDKMTDILYRRMWEQLYLKSDRTESTYYVSTGTLLLRLTLSEAFQFVKSATPPILAKNIPESTKSLKDIRDLLLTFLTEDNGEMLINYSSFFKQTTRLQPFETIWAEDTRKVDIMNKKMGKDADIVCNIVYANYSIDKLLTGRVSSVENTDRKMANINAIFKLNSPNGLQDFVNEIIPQNQRAFRTVINNIKIDDKTKSAYVSVYINGFITENLHKWIYDSYKNIIKK